MQTRSRASFSSPGSVAGSSSTMMAPVWYHWHACWLWPVDRWVYVGVCVSEPSHSTPPTTTQTHTATPRTRHPPRHLDRGRAVEMRVVVEGAGLVVAPERVD